MIETVGTFVLGVLTGAGWYRRNTLVWWVLWGYHKARGHHR